MNWSTVSFPTIDLLVAYLNEHGIRAGQCKIVVARDTDGAQVFHLLLDRDAPGRPPIAAAVAEPDPLVEAEVEEAVGAAEAIIAGAQRDE
jgi:hypothetical protein